MKKLLLILALMLLCASGAAAQTTVSGSATSVGTSKQTWSWTWTVTFTTDGGNSVILLTGSAYSTSPKAGLQNTWTNCEYGVSLGQAATLAAVDGLSLNVSAAGKVSVS